LAHSARTPGLRGRLPVKPLGERFALKWAHQYTTTGTFPPPSYPVDVSGGITNWGMLGNDQYGDCTFAGREHYKMAKAAAGHEQEAWETPDQLVAEYLAYDHGQDSGANIADLLLTWYKAGKILAFAPVDHTSPVQVDAAMAAFHGCYCGVSLTDDADQLFSVGLPWTTVRGEQPDPNEGHCIVKVAAEGHTGLDTWVTWGALQLSTPIWTDACLDEAWVIITQEDADAAGLDIAALRADIEALHGTGGQPPQPPPPSPPPTPPHGAPAWFVRFWEDVLTWLKART
jgi:hypothetical protein